MGAWREEFEINARARTAHVFLFHGSGVKDSQIHEGALVRPFELLPDTDAFKHAAIIAFFNLASGVRFPEADETNMKELFLSMIKEFADAERWDNVESYFEARKDDMATVLKWFNKLLHTSWASALSEHTDEHVKAYLSSKQPAKGKAPFAAIVIEYQESKTPPEAKTGSSRLDRKVAETIQWWAQFPPIAKTTNLLVLMCESLVNMPMELREQSNGIIPIEVPLPSREDMEETVLHLKKEKIFVPVAGEHSDLSEKEIAQQAAGLSRVEIKQVFLHAQAHKETLTSTVLFQKKAKIIEAKLGDLARLKNPPWGWESIGGMDEHVARFKFWAEAMRRGSIARLPKGAILLLGPPGTGKTVCAEAFAHELDLPFLEIMSTADPYYGVSERNMQSVVDTAWAMRPCVLFFDEMEQLLLPRGSYFHGDSGTTARSARILMQFFSDPNIHGQVVIFGASNRPDLMDEAMKREGRVGVKIPFPIPQKEDRESIWKALFQKEVVRLAQSGIEFDISKVIDNTALLKELSAMADFWNKDGKLTYGPPQKGTFKRRIVSLTGAEMEAIIALSLQPFIPDDILEETPPLSGEELFSRLIELLPLDQKITLEGDMLIEALKNYLPPERTAYEEMQDLALLSVNDLRLVPKRYRERAQQLRAERMQKRDIPPLSG